MKLSWLTALVLCTCVTIDISDASHHYKKSVIIHDQHAKKKFDIMAKPQVAPNAMTVIMKGSDGTPGKQGPQGDQGKPGPPGPIGPPKKYPSARGLFGLVPEVEIQNGDIWGRPIRKQGDQGPKGVCTRTQCENEQLKLVIQRLLALEKYVNSKLKNENKPVPPSSTPPANPCKKPTTGKPGSAQCAPAAAIIAILPLTQSLLKPGLGGLQGQGQGKGHGPGQVPAKGPSGVGGPGQAKPSQAGPQGRGQGQGKPSSSTMNLSLTSSPSVAGGAPATTGVPGSPGNLGSRVQPPRPTAPSVAGTPTAKRPAPPTGQPFVTLKGVTSYDLPMPPIGVPPQQVTVVGGPLNQFAAIPANWVTSGTGPIDLKPALYRRTPISRADKENFYSRGWDLAKKHNIPSPGHGLLTHKLASKMLRKSHDKKSKISKTKTIKHLRKHYKDKHHNKVTSKKKQKGKTRKTTTTRKKHH